MRANEANIKERYADGTVEFAPAETKDSTILFYNDPRREKPEIFLLTASGDTVHELGHVWDNRTGGALSSGIALATDSVQDHWFGIGFLPLDFREGHYRVGAGTRAASRLGEKNQLEDWAEALKVSVYPPNDMDPLRRAYVMGRLQPSQRFYGGR